MDDNIIKKFDLGSFNISAHNIKLKDTTIRQPIMVNETINNITKAMDMKRKLEDEEKIHKEELEQEKLNELKQIRGMMGKLGYSLDILVDSINTQVGLTNTELGQMNELLSEFKRAVVEGGSDEESKVKNILISGLNVSSKVALPLFVEYLKVEARKYGLLT